MIMAHDASAVEEIVTPDADLSSFASESTMLARSETLILSFNFSMPLFTFQSATSFNPLSEATMSNGT
jgi:hypothetical protein